MRSDYIVSQWFIVFSGACFSLNVILIGLLQHVKVLVQLSFVVMIVIVLCSCSDPTWMWWCDMSLVFNVNSMLCSEAQKREEESENRTKGCEKTSTMGQSGRASSGQRLWSPGPRSSAKSGVRSSGAKLFKLVFEQLWVVAMFIDVLIPSVICCSNEVYWDVSCSLFT